MAGSGKYSKKVICMKKKHYNIHNIVSVQIDSGVKKWFVNQIDFQIGHFRVQDSEELEYNISIYPYEDFNDENEGMSRFHNSYFDSGNILQDPENNIVIRKKDAGYDIFANSSFVINIFLQLLLAKEGITFVHAAAIKKPDGGVILLPGGGGVGKTAILGSMVKKEGYSLLGDDNILLKQDGNCLSFPRSFILKSYHESVYPEIFKQLSLKQKNNPSLLKVLKFVVKNAPFFNAARDFLQKRGWYNQVVISSPIPKDYVADVPVEKIFGRESIASEGEIEKVVFLERYQNEQFSLNAVNSSMLANRMFSIMHHEWADYMRELFTYGSTDLVYLDTYFENISQIINTGIRDKECFLLKIPESATPEELYHFFSKNI
jgi:hypothetical protein